MSYSVDLPRLTFREVDLQQMIDAMPCAAFVERAGQMVAWNAEAAALSGLEANGPVPAEQVFLGKYPFAARRPISPDAGALTSFRCMLLCRTGRPVTVQGALRTIQTESGPRRLVLAQRASSNDGDSMQEDSFLGELLDAAPEGMAITHNGHLLHVNREFTRLFDYPPAQCIGREIDSLLMPADRMHETETLYHLIASEGRAAMDTVRLTREGVPVDVSVLTGPVRLGRDYGLFHTFRDIGAQKEAVAQLQHKAMHDGLTGLANRRLFIERLEVARIRLRRRSSRTFGVLFLDLDGFKPINDRLGHAAGDFLLMAVAERLREHTRPQDTVARFGGDEFAVLLEEAADEERVMQVARRMQEAIAQPIPGEESVMRVSASIGAAFIDVFDLAVDAIVRQADIAMYHAKSAGKARCSLYQEGMTMLAKAS